MSRLTLTSGALFALLATAHACGPWLPNRYLENGGSAVLAAPEFYFEIEMKDLAKSFAGPFKAKPAQSKDDAPSQESADADTADFADALAARAIAPPDAEAATAQHLAARQAIGGPAAGEEFPSEFAIYHRGARAFHSGDKPAARTAWTELLALPAAQRHYRSTWAAFMLGKLDLAEKSPDAKKWFTTVREQAKAGFADTLGLAAASLGWEARAELNDNALEPAARLYLEQLATGDRTAVDSLLSVAKQLVTTDTDLQKIAANAVLEPVATRFILSRMVTSSLGEAGENGPGDLSTAWLAAMENSDQANIGDAARLGWTAYTAGHFDEAERWLKRADPNSGLALWLKSKLDFRAGKLADATAAMAKALPQIPQIHGLDQRDAEPWETMPIESATADLGLMQLARNEFSAAFLTLAKGGVWQDAAFLAERVLTTGELLAIVRKTYPWSAEQDAKVARDEVREGSNQPKETHAEWLERCVAGSGQFFMPGEIRGTLKVRWLLARRLARLGRFAEARPFFPAPLRLKLDEYTAGLKRGQDAKLPRSKRAAALWAAAQIARSDGMELLGTEVEPDGFIWDGNYEVANIRTERLAGKWTEHKWVNVPDGYTKRITVRPLVVPLTTSERARLKATPVEPNERFHYRFIAADIAWRAAKLMPDNSEETAIVLNTAGRWLKDRYHDSAERFYNAIESRCANTELGRAAIAIRWFPPNPEQPPTQ